MNIGPYLRLMRIERPIGNLLLLWPTLWALWLAASGSPSAHIVLIFIAGTFIMRAAGCVINDIADRKFDGHVERTKNRPLVTGEISLSAALILFFALLLSALFLLLQLNTLSFKVAIGAVLLVIVYPFCKRITHLPQFVLGAAFSSAILMAYAAIQNNLSLSAWLLFIANIAHTVAYDTEYAMVDRDDDVLIGVKSTAILFGPYDRLAIALLMTLTLIILAIVGVINTLNSYYYFGLMLAASSSLYQVYLCRTRDRNLCFRAFLNNAWFGAIIFFAILLAYLPI